MSLDLIPRSFWNVPSRLPAFFDEEDDWKSFLPSSGLTVSEDDKGVYIEAAVPGIEPENIEATYDKGILWIRAGREHADEDKERKFYRRASTSFSYRIAVPGEVDGNAEPDVTVKNGMVRVTFQKIEPAVPKKLNVKVE